MVKKYDLQNLFNDCHWVNYNCLILHGSKTLAFIIENQPVSFRKNLATPVACFMKLFTCVIFAVILISYTVCHLPLSVTSTLVNIFGGKAVSQPLWEAPALPTNNRQG